MTTDTTPPVPTAVGERQLFQYREGSDAWNVEEVVSFGDAENDDKVRLIAIDLSKADAELLCHGHADLARLRAALDQCDMVMDTAAILGLPQELPEVYRNSWAAAHQAARAALAPRPGDRS